jgi:UDP-N-acetylmuramoyl-tripeptide--D-alanyl-D-alanine ligase
MAGDFWHPSALARITGGWWLGEPAGAKRITGAGIDTRSMQPGEAFVAVVGEKRDGHTFLKEAANKGAALALVEPGRVSPQQAEAPHLPLLAVRDTLAALHALAGAYRDRLAERGTTVIAVAGSNGKTTTRDLIHTALSASLSGHQAPKSFNNHLGVPLTLLGAPLPGETEGTAPPPQRYVLLEIGTNHPGEIAMLRRLARPDVAVLTSLGREHLGHFGSIEDVAAEEASLLTELPAGAAAVVEREAANLLRKLGLLSNGLPLITFGGPASRPQAARHAAVENVEWDMCLTSPPTIRGQRQRFTVNDQIAVDLPLLGRHNAVNALAALAVAQWLGLSTEAAAGALGRVEPVEGRMQPVALGPSDQPLTLIHDAYNANPDSMQPALRTLEQLQSGARRTIAILGDMGELGDRAEREHTALGQWLTAEGPSLDRLITVGARARSIADAVAPAWGEARVAAFDVLDDATVAAIARQLEPGDLVLLKASRSMKLERLIPAIESWVNNG